MTHSHRKRNWGRGPTVGLLAVAAACGPQAEVPGFGQASFLATCPQDNLDCFMTTMFVKEGGSDVDLVMIYSELPKPTSTGKEPTVVANPSSLTFGSWREKPELALTWTDPNRSQPTFCYRACKPPLRCSNLRLCSRSKRDGLVQGVWRTNLQYSAAPVGPAGTTEEFGLEVTPLSMPSGEDPATIMKAADQANTPLDSLGISAGMPATVQQKIVSKEAHGGSGGTMGGGGSSGGGGKARGSACSATSECQIGLACLSQRNCIVSALGNPCECSTLSSSGVCEAAPNNVCIQSGKSCTANCCPDLSCNNGVCEDSRGGRCPGQ